MKNVRFSRNGVDFEPTKQELKIVLDDYAKQLGENDKRIKVLEKALEIACANHPAVCDDAMDCSKGVDCVGCLIEHYKAQARKELKNE